MERCLAEALPRRTKQRRARAWRGRAPPALYASGGAKTAGKQCAEARLHADCPPHLAGHFVASCKFTGMHYYGCSRTFKE